MKKTERKPTVLVVDDDKNTRDGLEKALCEKYEVVLASSGEAALDILREKHVDILLSDMRMPGLDGITLVQRTLAHDPTIICIVLTAYGTVETAVEAMKRGAYDFLMKPVNLDHLELLLQRALEQREMASENIRLRKQLDDRYGLENIVGSSPAMKRVFETVRQAAPTDATILLLGESGTGKELVAQAIHRLSNRAKGPFIAVHCAALAPNLLESELFGHEKGAFTGAIARRRGRFELADGGTLFLDEVSEIDPAIQVKLLRVLEERKFERVGGDETIETDIRLIAASNRDLKALVEEGRFRQDLYFRLDVVTITLPPLRERLEDVPLLCDYFLREFAEKNNRPIEGITSDALNILSAYHWPGNVRELRNTIEKMVVLSRGGKLTARDVPVAIKEAVKGRGVMVTRGAHIQEPTGETLADVEKRLILSTLKRVGGSRTVAARELGISRRTLHRKLKQYQAELDGSSQQAAQ
ncbi:MAG: sigma-54 dependent transcriptional regulator [Kiritimatiellae bacterium]|nr:sigma-54 dependent transcriptional regulator [Kiritimatiellia bacterium]